ncbi:M48 family metalloprotease [Paludisphaera sp.]|uniref:M48 family metalloprotease n=1 Tax=Paludisphaera sp. TaxID=2017432 RepID=UPI00301C6C11
MNDHWYCMIDGRVEGPVDDHGLRGLAGSGRLAPGDQVRRGADGPWVAASRCRGLFDAAPAHPNGAAHPNGSARRAAAPLANVRTAAACVSAEERKKRPGVYVVNTLIWVMLTLLAVGTMGAILVFYGIGWIVNRLLAEYNVRKLQAMGVLSTPRQFPEVEAALREVCDHFGVAEPPRVIILNAGEMNAFAIKFARKRVIVLLTPFLEGSLDNPAELRFVLGHELGHTMLDHGPRGVFEIYKPAAYKAARELTCDACGCAAAGDLESSKTALKRLVAGNELHARLDEADLTEQADTIYSGLSGWLLRQYLTYPPIGKRLSHITRFFEVHA